MYGLSQLVVLKDHERRIRQMGDHHSAQYQIERAHWGESFVFKWIKTCWARLIRRQSRASRDYLSSIIKECRRFVARKAL